MQSPSESIVSAASQSSPSKRTSRKSKKSRISKKSHIKTTNFDEELKNDSDAGSLNGRASIEREFCGHDPSLCISSVPQWKIVFKTPVTFLQFKVIFQPRHQKCFFFTAHVKGERFISTEDPNSTNFQRTIIPKDVRVTDVTINCSEKPGYTQVFGVYATMGDPLDYAFVVKGSEYCPLVIFIESTC